MIDISKLSNEELNELCSSLKERGIISSFKSGNAKERYFDTNRYLNRPDYMEIHYSELKSATYLIADSLTDNFTTRTTKSGMRRVSRNTGVPEEKADRYKEICDDIMAAIDRHLPPITEHKEGSKRNDKAGE